MDFPEKLYKNVRSHCSVKAEPVILINSEKELFTENNEYVLDENGDIKVENTYGKSYFIISNSYNGNKPFAMYKQIK